VHQAKLNPTYLRGLLDAIDKKQIASIRFADSHTEANGLVIGGDFINNELLICDTYPNVSNKLISTGQHHPFWLRIKTGSMYLCVSMVTKSVENGLITASILSVSTSENKRWYNRTEFAPLQGPEVRINREFASNVSGRLKNLSAGGAAIDIWGREMKQDLKGQALSRLTIVFNNHFEISLDCKVLNSQFIRQPSCHTQLRVQFTNTNTLDHYQLAHFVDSTDTRYAA